MMFLPANRYDFGAAFEASLSMGLIKKRSREQVLTTVIVKIVATKLYLFAGKLHARTELTTNFYGEPEYI